MNIAQMKMFAIIERINVVQLQIIPTTISVIQKIFVTRERAAVGITSNAWRPLFVVHTIVHLDPQI